VVGCDLLVVVPDRSRLADGQRLASEARSAGLAARLELSGRSVKAALKHADRIGARAVALIEQDGVSLKDMATGAQEIHQDTSSLLAALDRRPA